MNVTNRLSELITGWIEKKPSRNIRMLSRLSDTSYSSVWRAANKEGEISQTIALAIANVIMTKVEMQNFIGEYYPHLIDAVVSVQRGSGEQRNLEELVKSPEYFKLLLLASSKTGTCSDEIVQMYGESYLTYFEDLIASGELTELDGRWMLAKDIGLTSLKLARQMLAEIAGSCNPSNDAKPYSSYAYLGWESLNEKAAKKVYKSIEKFNQDIYDIVSNEENKGNVLVVYGLLQNVLKGQESLA